MAQTAYWIAHPTSGWLATPTGAQIAAGFLSDGTTVAAYSGSETGFATTGVVTIDEATAITGASASTSYTQAWTVYDSSLGTYAPPVVGSFTTAAASVGVAVETDTAFALSAVQIKAIGLATESDSALALAAVQIATVGLATETNTAFALLPNSPGTVGLAVETDAALALGGVQIAPVGIAAETDSAFALNGVSAKAVGLATESDTAFALAAVQKMLVGIALETNTSLYLGLSGPPRIKGLRKTRYTPGRPPSSLGESGRFIQQELERITDGLESPFTHEMLELLSVEPGRKPTSAVMLAAADGANWNPGSGRGLYLYYGGTWALVKAF